MINQSTGPLIGPYLGLKIGGPVVAIEKIKKAQEAPAVFAKAKTAGLPLFILGGGTNTVFYDSPHELIVGKIEIPGINIDGDIVTVGAGVDWDELVSKTIDHNLAGLEALSAIPGTVGASPVQNIGAYGAELADTFISLTAFDTEKNDFVEIKKSDCGFSYRQSMFKKNPGRFIITNVTLKLNKLSGRAPIPNYPGVRKYLEENNISPTLAGIREAITAIRWSKLPDPTTIPNSGSFFENPFVEKTLADKLKVAWPDMPQFLQNEKVKIPAGWLIEQAGLKGVTEGGVGTYDKNALVVINQNRGNFKDLENLIQKIQTTVWEKFGIELKPEVNVV